MSTEIILNEETENYIGGLLNCGEKVNGYTITGRLDTSSGEGEIYYCEKDSKRYILKYYYRKNIFSDLEKSLKSLNHKNVMKILDAGTYKKHSYEIDEYYNGGTLLDIQLPLSENDAFDIIEQLNEGLKAIHSAGIIHRDIKAENIYFKDSSKKEIVIGDFGIATVYDQKDDVNEHLTTIDSSTDGYKAPESFNGIIGPSIDYYSLGITVWNILTGKTPFVEAGGEAYPSGKIKYETINERIKDDLLSQSPELSEKAKTLISGLLVYRHDQRWRYEEVKDFLAGKDVPVFTERRDLKAFEFGNKEFFNLKDLAEALLQNIPKGIELLHGTQLTRYLDNNDLGNSITPKIEKIQNEYFSDSIDNNSLELLGGVDSNEEREEYGLIKAAFALCSNIRFPLSYFGKAYEINTMADFMDLLRTHPMAIRPYLLKECYGLYAKLDAIVINKNQESLSAKIKTVVENSKNSRTLPLSIYLGLTENKIKPFMDKINGNIELQSQDDVYALPDNLKERLMYLVDSKNKLIIAWFESVFGVDMNEWYGELEGGASHDENISNLRRNKIRAFGSWNYFEKFINGDDVIYRKPFPVNGKYGLLNLDGTEDWPAQFEDVHCEFSRNQYIIKSNGIWRVLKANEKGNYDAVVISDGEISILDEKVKLDEEGNVKKYKIYRARTINEDDSLFLEGTAESPVVPLLIENLSIGHIEAYSEVMHPNERYINTSNGRCQLLDSEYRIIDSFDKLQVITADGEVPENLTFWAKKNNEVFLINKDAKIIEKYPYVNFVYAGNNCFIVTDIEGKKNVVSYNNNLIKTNVESYKSSGILAAVKRNFKTKWELLNLENENWIYKDKKYKEVGYLGKALFALNSYKKIFFFTDSNNDAFTTKMTMAGKGGVISNSIGLKKKFSALNDMTIKRICSSSEKEAHYYILGFDGQHFYKYNFDTLCFDTLYSTSLVPEDEFYDLMANVDAKRIIHLVKRYIKDKKTYEKANILINLTWKYYYDKGNFEVARFLLSSVRMDIMDELDLTFLAYKNFLGHTYLKENETLENCYKTKDLIKRNQNYSFALNYLLSAAGKDVASNGEIITAPYIYKLDMRPNLALDCADVCVKISNLEHNIYLSFGWTKEYLKNVATDILYSLYNYYTETNYNSNPYFELYRIGSLFALMEDYKKAIDVYKTAIPYEQGFSVINASQLFILLHGTQQYKDAMSIYEQIRKTYPDIDKSPLIGAYEDCKRRLGY